MAEKEQMEAQPLDQPISSESADLLGFKEISNVLGDAIEQQPNTSSITLGLDGPWGSGKTSILSLLQESLNRRQAGKAEDEIGLVVVPFSPWLITNRSALVAGFFKQLTAAMDEAVQRAEGTAVAKSAKVRRKLSSARKQLGTFGRLATLASNTIGIVNPTVFTAATIIQGIAQFFSKEADETVNLEDLKHKIEANLVAIAEEDPSFKILVLIDDLDRLDPSDSLEVIRLVKAVGDFPAVTYLLAYDRPALSEAIARSAKIENGDEYLEKIIQFSFKVPPLEPFRLRNWLKSEIENLYPTDADYGSERARVVFDIWAGRLLRTPRDVRRLVLAIRTIWPSLRERADLLDLIWLQIVKEKASSSPKADLYDWTTQYLQSLDAIAIGGRVTGVKEDTEKLTEILKKIGWHMYEEEVEKMSFDFHGLDEILAGVTQSYLGQLGHGEDWTYQIDEEELQEYRASQRLSSPWHWRLYFALDTPSHALTDDEWRALVDAAKVSEDDLSAAIAKVIELRNTERLDVTDQVLDRAIYAQRSRELSNAFNWLIVVVKNAANLRKASKPDVSGFHRRFNIQVNTLAREVFRRLGPEERQSAIESIFVESIDLSVAAELFRDQLYTSRKGEFDRKENLFLTVEELETIGKAQLKQYEALSPEDFTALQSPYDVLYAWRDIEGESGPKVLLENAFKDDQGLTDTLEALRTITSSAQEGIPHIPEGWLANFVDTKKLKKRLEKTARGSGAEASHARRLLDVWWSREKH